MDLSGWRATTLTSRHCCCSRFSELRTRAMIRYWTLAAGHCLLCIVGCIWHVVRCLLDIACCELPAVNCLLYIAIYIACCALPAVYCQLYIACCTLAAALGALVVVWQWRSSWSVIVNVSLQQLHSQRLVYTKFLVVVVTSFLVA